MTQVMFCRHSSCWRLDLLTNTWSRAASLHRERDQAASVALGDRMMVLGGQGLDSTGLATSEVEIYHTKNDSWTLRPDLALPEGRFSFCAVPLNTTAVMVLGGWGSEGPLSEVTILDMETGQWRPGPDMTTPRYGHTCLLTELAGRLGVLMAGGALTGKKVEFLDLQTNTWEEIANTNYRIGKHSKAKHIWHTEFFPDGHKLILVEGIPTIFSWENIEQFDGKHSCKNKYM